MAASRAWREKTLRQRRMKNTAARASSVMREMPRVRLTPTRRITRVVVVLSGMLHEAPDNSHMSGTVDIHTRQDENGVTG